MPKAFYTAVILFVCYGAAFGQNRELDSLRALADTSSGQQRADYLNDIAFRMLIINLGQAYAIAEDAYLLSSRLNYERGMTEALVYKGIYQLQRGNRIDALKFLKSGNQKSKALKAVDMEGYSAVQLGNVFRYYGEYDSALYWYNIAYPVLKDSAYPRELSIYYRNLSRYYGLLSRYPFEYQYLHRSLSIRKKLKDKVLLADNYLLLTQWHLQQGKLDSALAYINHAERVTGAEESEIKTNIEEQKAAVYFRQAKYKEAIQSYTIVKKYYEKNGAKNLYVRLINNTAEVLWEAGNYDVSLDNYFEALKVAQDGNLVNDVIKSRLGIAWNYYRLKQFAMARQFADDARKAAIEPKLAFEQATALNIMGLTFKAERKYEEALTYFNQALELRKNINDRIGEGATLGNIGETYEALGRYQDALAVLGKSLKLKESTQHQSGLAWAYTDLGSVHLKLKNFTLSDHYITKAIQTARKINLGVVLLEASGKKRELLRAQGRIDEAFRFTLQYEALKDSIQTTLLSNRIATLQSAYEIESRDRAIELLTANKLLQEQQIAGQQNKIERQRLIIIVVVIIILLVAALAAVAYRFYSRVNDLNKNIQEQKEEIQAQAEELVQTNHSLQVVNVNLIEQKEELQAQAEELTEANAVIYDLNKNLENKVQERTVQLTKAYKELDTFLYRSSHDFRRPLTTFFGLAEVAKISFTDRQVLDLFDKVKVTARNLDQMLAKLQAVSALSAEEYARKVVYTEDLLESSVHANQELIKQTNTKIKIQRTGNQPLNSFPIILKLIVDNLLENAIHFNDGKPEVVLEARVTSTELSIAVDDNGIGISSEIKDSIFDLFFRGSELSKGNGLGLYIVRRAVDKLNGTIAYEQLPRGSRFTIQIPIE